MNKLLTVLIVGSALCASTARAQWTFYANLSGTGENPVNASPATGFGQVILNAAQNQITVDESWSGLVGGPATASHIHGPGGVGTNAPVLFPFASVPAVTSGSIPTQTFAISALQVSYLFNGYLYMNVHDGSFPGGEIRGQLLLVPEPSTMALASVGSLGFMYMRRRKAAQRCAS
jgi:hypothetical protein